jgi:hypothetical protein
MSMEYVELEGREDGRGEGRGYERKTGDYTYRWKMASEIIHQKYTHVTALGDNGGGLDGPAHASVIAAT